MEFYFDSFKIWVLFDGENYIWVQPENEEGYWDGDKPENIPTEFFEKIDNIYKSVFN